MAISISQAREILGSDAEALSDEEIHKILEGLYLLANDLLDGSRDENL